MNKPSPFERAWLVNNICQHVGCEDASEVMAEWADDWEAVRLTAIETGKQSLWLPVAPEAWQIVKNHVTAHLVGWPPPNNLRH